MAPKWNAWHIQLRNMEPYIPDFTTAEVESTYSIIFGLEKLLNMEAISQHL